MTVHEPAPVLLLACELREIHARIRALEAIPYGCRSAAEIGQLEFQRWRLAAVRRRIEAMNAEVVACA